MRKRGYAVIFLALFFVLASCYTTARGIILNSDNINDIIVAHRLKLESIDRELKDLEWTVKEYARIIEQYE